MARRWSGLSLLLLVGCAELGAPPVAPCPERRPVTTTIQLARLFCEPGEAWEPCLLRVHAQSSAEGGTTVLTVPARPQP